jgi:hypothetical protein
MRSTKRQHERQSKSPRPPRTFTLPTPRLTFHAFRLPMYHVRTQKTLPLVPGTRSSIRNPQVYRLPQYPYPLIPQKGPETNTSTWPLAPLIDGQMLDRLLAQAWRGR